MSKAENAILKLACIVKDIVRGTTDCQCQKYDYAQCDRCIVIREINNIIDDMNAKEGDE